MIAVDGAMVDRTVVVDAGFAVSMGVIGVVVRQVLTVVVLVIGAITVVVVVDGSGGSTINDESTELMEKIQ